APRSERARRSFDGSAVAVATSVMNVATYGFTIIAARVIGPSEYGAFAACLSFLLVVQVGALGLQATAARRIALDRGHVAAIEKAMLRLTAKVSVVVGLVMLALVPVIDRLLNLDDLLTAVIVALTAVPLTVAGGQAGVLQGERRWRSLAVFYVTGGVPRLVVGTALILWRPDATTALLGVGIGFLFPVAMGAWLLRHRRTP
ncbi:MAG TPA: oligosaccharide flippase family protein, partial [Nocardioides sp.]|nr:oligosaccharide flippase family protein [Nocardioides sp.]